MIDRLWLLFAVAAALAALGTPVVRWLAQRHVAGARPLAAAPHAEPRRPTPRLGGLAVAAAWFSTVLLGAAADNGLGAALRAEPLATILPAAFVVFATGVWDDLRPLPPGPKLAMQVIASAIVIAGGVFVEHITLFGYTVPLGPLGWLSTMLWIVTITNAFNLVDGLDGLACGLAIIAGATCALIATVRGEHATAALLVAFVGGLVGFLPYNFNPASIFLGDGGSLLAGFVLAVTAITGWQKGATTLAVGVPLLILAVPILDTAAAVVRRWPDGRRASGVRGGIRAVVQGDQEHIHHRLVGAGWSHRATVLLLYLVTVCLCGLAWWSVPPP